jgi:hypothetical protein
MPWSANPEPDNTLGRNLGQPSGIWQREVPAKSFARKRDRTKAHNGNGIGISNPGRGFAGSPGFLDSSSIRWDFAFSPEGFPLAGFSLQNAGGLPY